MNSVMMKDCRVSAFIPKGMADVYKRLHILD